MSSSILQNLQQKIDSYKEDVFSMQQTLTAIPAIAPDNGGTGEIKKAELIKTYLENLRMDDFQEIHAPDNRVPEGYRTNLFARWNGKSDARTVWIMAHMDVVPPGDIELWDHDPFDVIEKDGKLYGRGTEDNQQAIVSALLAVKAIRELDLEPESGIGLAIVSDEENGSKYGIEYVLNNHSDIFGKDDLILIPDAGDEKGITIEIAEKSILWMRVETKGIQTHGSTPEKGANAYKAAAHLIVKMEELYSLYDQSESLYEPPISTFEPTKKESNVDNVNTIPGSDVFYFDCRILPEYNLTEILSQVRTWADEIEAKFHVQISITTPQNASAPPPTSPDAPVVHALKKAIKEVTGQDALTIGIGGGTVAAEFRKVGLPAVCWCTLDDTLHGPNEYSVIENTLTDAKVFAHLFLQKS
ncbi:M20 family metallo-hydrolase [candidate division KSB1 bacterium]|nr:M20 family metallo-hydrolase [candidate division KSB1 bacterium]